MLILTIIFGVFVCNDGVMGLNCQSDQFDCGNWQCVLKEWVCDGENDCSNGRDEAICEITTATVPDSTDWYSSPGADSSDGVGQSICPLHHFHCGEGQCIQESWVCDNEQDCVNGFDEDNCASLLSPNFVSRDETSTENLAIGGTAQSECTENQFHCGHGQCILKAWVCDAEEDCLYGQDEANCALLEVPDFTTTEWSVDTTEISASVHSTHTTQFLCEEGYFNCGDQQCILLWLVCDGSTDCTNGLDETNCQEFSYFNFTTTKSSPQLPKLTPPPSASLAPQTVSSPVHETETSSTPKPTTSAVEQTTTSSRLITLPTHQFKISPASQTSVSQTPQVIAMSSDPPMTSSRSQSHISLTLLPRTSFSPPDTLKTTVVISQPSTRSVLERKEALDTLSSVLQIQCDHSFCNNAGTCYVNQSSRYCRCSPEYEGKWCEFPKSRSTVKFHEWVMLSVIGVCAIILIFIIFLLCKLNRKIESAVLRLTTTKTKSDINGLQFQLQEIRKEKSIV